MQCIYLDLQPEIVNILFQGNSYPVQKQKLEVEEVFEHAPCILHFTDGSHCEIHGEEDKQALLAYLGYRPSLIQRWQKKWQWSLLSIILMVGMLFAAKEWGVPMVADKIAAILPVKYEHALGVETLKLLDQTMLSPSRLSDQRIAQVEEVLQRLHIEKPRVPIHLEVRSSARFGANAFALPGGTIVVTDELVLLITGSGGNDLTGGLAEELAGVLAHEVGHVQGNHGMRGLMRNSMVAMIASGLFSDFSSVAGVVPAWLVGMKYSREMESEADGFAIRCLQQAHISPARLADVLEEMERMRKRGSSSSSRGGVAQYMSSHPATEDRVARFRGIAVGPSTQE